MTEETAQALIRSMDRHSLAMEELAHELSCFDTYAFEDAASNLMSLFDKKENKAYAERHLGPL